jgi:hypothetical protein
MKLPIKVHKGGHLNSMMYKGHTAEPLLRDY